MVNDGATTSIQVPEADGKMRLWRGTSVANLAAGATATLPNGTLGYEWDSDLDNGARPAGLVRMSSTTVNAPSVLQDYGSTYGSGTATHNLTLYRRANGGGLVFGAGTVQWSWGLDATHDRGGTAASTPMQQATVNLFADMGAQPATIASGLTAATASTDTTAPTATITSPTAGAVIAPGSAVTITGTATDTGGRVGGVEVSTDNGATWHPATGRATWTYAWTAGAAGSVTILARAVDDSANLQGTPASVTVTRRYRAAAGGADGADRHGGRDRGEVGLGGQHGPGIGGVCRVPGRGGHWSVHEDHCRAVLSASTWEDTLAPAGTSYYRVTALNSAGGGVGPVGGGDR